MALTADSEGAFNVRVSDDPGVRGDLAAETTLESPESIPNSHVHPADPSRPLGPNLCFPAGRFVCNYIYFLSQRQCAAHPGWHALFVHVPAFAVVAEPLQRAFLMSLLRGIAALPQLQTPTFGDSEAADGAHELAPTAVSKQQAGKPAKESVQVPTPHAALVWTASAAAVTYLASKN